MGKKSANKKRKLGAESNDSKSSQSDGNNTRSSATTTPATPSTAMDQSFNSLPQAIASALLTLQDHNIGLLHNPPSVTSTPIRQPGNPTGQHGDQQTILARVETKLDAILDRLHNVESTVTAIDNRVRQVDSELSGVNSKVNDLEEAVKFTRNMADTIGSIDTVVKDLSTQLSNLHLENNLLRDNIDDITLRSMRGNLLFHGVDETQDEDCEVVVHEFLEKQLEIPNATDIKLDRAHRLGRKRTDRVRPIVAKFTYYKEKEMIKSRSVARRATLKQSNVGVSDQVPSQVHFERKRLMPEFIRAKERNQQVRWQGRKLLVDGRVVQAPEREDRSAGKGRDRRGNRPN